jgi:hypothetical protein
VTAFDYCPQRGLNIRIAGIFNTFRERLVWSLRIDIEAGRTKTIAHFRERMSQEPRGSKGV